METKKKEFFFPDFLKFQIDGLSKQIDDWMERYVKEAEELDIEIGQLKDAIQDIKSKNEDITGKYDLRQIDINEYHEEQRILEEKRKFEEKQCNSAIRIQVNLGIMSIEMFYANEFSFISVLVARSHGENGTGTLSSEEEK